MPLGWRWSKSQSSEGLRLNRPKVEPCAIAGKPLPAMKNSSTLKLQPLCPEVYTLIAAWLFLWETIQMQETTRNSKITHTATPSPTTSALSDPGTTSSTGGIFPGRGTCHIPNTCCTRCTANTLGHQGAVDSSGGCPGSPALCHHTASSSSTAPVLWALVGSLALQLLCVWSEELRGGS